jgi:Lar family restriction alleviation protein
MKMKDELQPCPFCGGEATLTDARGWRSPHFDVGCKKCSFNIWPDNNREKVITAWNTRAREAWQAREPEIAELKALLEVAKIRLHIVMSLHEWPSEPVI